VVGTEQPHDSIVGELLAITGSQLTIATNTSDRCVLTSDATILRITNQGLNIEELEIGDLETGETLEIFGAEDNGGCFAADVIIAKPASEETSAPAP